MKMSKLTLILFSLTLILTPLSSQAWWTMNNDPGPEAVQNSISRGCGEDFDGVRDADGDFVCLQFYRAVVGNMVLIGDFLGSFDRRDTLEMVLGEGPLPTRYIRDNTEVLVPYLGEPVFDPISIFQGEGPLPTIPIPE